MTKSLHSDRYAELLVVLRSARQLAGLTQGDIAKRLGKPQSYVSKLERGERRIDVIEFIDFIEVSGFDPVASLNALIGTLGEMPDQPSRKRNS